MHRVATGDRYIGYDYATKKPLDDFLLRPPLLHHNEQLSALASERHGVAPLEHLDVANMMALLMAQPPAAAATSTAAPARPVVTVQPVAAILGRQHYVDAVYHDLSRDLVHIFTGMKYYTYEASLFKDGVFRTSSSSSAPPPMRCTNAHLLSGCTFDVAYPNPCVDDVPPATPPTSATSKPPPTSDDDLAFSDEQQMKLRSIASRSGGLIDILYANSLTQRDGGLHKPPTDGASAKLLDANGHALPPPPPTSQQQQPQQASSSSEKIVIYLLMAMVAMTVLVTLAMIGVIVNWTRKSQAANAAAVAAATAAAQSAAATAAPVRASRHSTRTAHMDGAVQPVLLSSSHAASHRHSQQQHQHRRHHRAPSSAHRLSTSTTAAAVGLAKTHHHLAPAGMRDISGIGGGTNGHVGLVGVARSSRSATQARLAANYDNSAL